MPQHEVGIWILFTSVTTILEMIRSGFIRNPFITHYNSATELTQPGVINTSFQLHCVLGIITSFVLLIGGLPLANFWQASGLENLFYLYAINNLILVPYLHFEYLLTAKLNFRMIFVCDFVRNATVAIYIFMCYVLKIESSLEMLAMMQIASTILGAIVAYPQVRHMMKLQFSFNKRMFFDMFHFGKYTFGTNISSMFIRGTDSWMIGRMISAAAVAVYSPAIRLANIFEVPTLAIANVIFPHVATKMRSHGKQGVRDVYIKSVSLMLALTIPMVLPLYIFAEEVVGLIFGKEYMESANILRVTIFYSMIIPFNRQFGTIMDGLKKPKLNFYLLVIMAVCNVVLNYFMLNAFGLIGSAYATLTSYLLIFVLNQIILQRAFKINTLKVFEGIFTWYKIGWNLVCARLIKAPQPNQL